MLDAASLRRSRVTQAQAGVQRPAVTPAQAGVQSKLVLDSGLRRNDGQWRARGMTAMPARRTAGRVARSSGARPWYDSDARRKNCRRDPRFGTRKN
jgi:hypothetical protein